MAAKPYVIDEEHLQSVLTVDSRSIGSTGLRYSGGVVMEERLRQLEGQRGMFRFKEMVDNDPICGATIQLILNLVRGVQWDVKPASGHPQDQEAANFLESCMHDMYGSWLDHICEMMSMCIYGFSVHEMILKQRAGGDPRTMYGSKYADGRFGWKWMPIRSQDSITGWDIRPDGTIYGFRQQCMPNNVPVDIRMDRCLHVRTMAHKNDPTGRSIFRSAFIPYTRKCAIELIEGIGIERELAGLPVMGVPAELLAKGASDDKKAMARHLSRMLANIKADEKASVLYPLEYDDKGNQLYKLELLSSGGARAIDTDKIIQRYDQRIAIAAQTDFMLLGGGGSGSTGSWAMHSDKTRMFIDSIGAFLDIICAELNTKAVPYLMDSNSFRMSDYPKIQYSGLEKTDMAALGMYLTQLSCAGMQLFPNDDLERACLQVAGLPEPPSDDPTDKPVKVRPNQIGVTGVKMLSDPGANQDQQSSGAPGMSYNHGPIKKTGHLPKPL